MHLRRLGRCLIFLFILYNIPSLRCLGVGGRGGGNDGSALPAPYLTAKLLSTSSALLSWSDSGGSINYLVERREGKDGHWLQIAVTTNGTTSHKATGLDPRKTYYFRVRAFDIFGESDNSNDVEVSTFSMIPPAPPEAPSDLAATAVSTSAIVLSWRDNSSTELGFIVEMKKDGETAWTTAAELSYNSTATTISGLATFTKYHFRVIADGRVDSDPSNEASATTKRPIPGAPAGLTAQAILGNEIRLTWQDDTIYEDGYRVERKISGVWTEVGTTFANATSHTDTGLEPLTLYEYRVRAYNTEGYSSYSQEASATTLKWALYTVTDSAWGKYPSVTVHGSQAKVGFSGGSNSKVSSFSDGSFSTETLPVQETTKNVKVITDSSDSLHLFYINQDGLLRHYRKNSSAWDIETLTSSTESYAVTVHGSSLAIISKSSGTFTFLTGNFGSWSSSATGLAGDFPSIASYGGVIHLAYYSDATTSLKYATSTLWDTVTIDSSGNAGMDTSIGITGSGTVYISYYDLSAGDLKVAVNSGGGWSYSTIDSGGNTGRFSSLATDSSGYAHILYFDSGGNLKYATNSSGSWLLETIENVGAVSFTTLSGQGTSLYIDPSGKLKGAYTHITAGTIKYIRN